MANYKGLSKIAFLAGKNGNNIVNILSTAVMVVGAAHEAIQAAKPLAEDLGADAAINNAKDGAQKAANAAMDAAQNGIKQAGSKLGAIAQDLNENRKARSRVKQINDQRKTVLDNAMSSTTADTFLAAKENAANGGNLPLPIGNLPGCYIIATYKHGEKNSSNYSGIYVGKANDIAQAVETTIGRNGNPDIYADIKYKQDVRIYVFNSKEDEINAVYDALYATFNDSKLYI